RDVVLKRDGEGVRATTECKIVEGSWFSPYDGKTLTDPQDLDIDHMVPLANAWRTGASRWSDEQREQFANDLDRPQLIAVTSSTNRSKGDQDPSQWKPPRRAYWCTYAQDWVAVKSYWRLSVTADEKAALKDMLETC
ncbi:MAG TPA: HNH endonuclease family protein, partial [Micromonosporaceae bacterium]